MRKFHQCIVATLSITLALLVSPAMAQATDTIKFAFQDRIGSVLPIIAVSKGYFAEQGLQIEPLRFNSGPACAEALYSGAADIGAMGDTAAIITVVRDPRYRIFASHATGENRHRLMIRQDGPFTSLHDLKGKRLAVKKGTSTYGGLLAALKRDKIDPASMQIIDLAPPTMVTALQSGSIDAFAASEPTPSIAEEKGAKQLITFGGLENLYPLVMLARNDFSIAHAAEMKRFVAALTRAEEYAHTHPQEVIDLMSAETGLSPVSTRSAIARHQYSLRLDDNILTSLKKTAMFLQEQKVIEQTPDWTHAIDGAFVH